MAGQNTLSYVQLNSLQPQKFLTRLLPLEVARRYEVVPLELRENRLVTACGWQLSHTEKAELQRTLHYPLDFVPASLPDVRAARRRLYGAEDEVPARLPPADALKALGLLDDAQIANLRKNQNDNDHDLITAALKAGLINAEQYSEAVGWSAYLPHIRQRTANPLKNIRVFFPFDQSEAKQALPLWWVNGVLYLALPDADAAGEADAARPVICDPLVFGQLRKVIYQPRTARHIRTSEREVAERLVGERVLEAEALALALEMQARTGIALKRVLLEQRAITSRDWLDAGAEIENRIPLHAEDLPDDIHERVRRLWHLLPETVSLQFNLLPLNLEKDTLVLGMAEYDPDLAELAAAFSGYRIEARLMEEGLIQALQEGVRAATDAAAGGGLKPLALGDFLAQSGLMQRSQLAEIEDAKDVGEFDLENALLQSNLLNEIDLAEIYSLMSGIPYLTLEYFQLDGRVTGLLPADWALEQRVLPLFERAGDLWVGVADLKSCDMLGQAAERCGMRVWPLLVPRAALAAALNRCYQFNRAAPLAADINALADNMVKANLISQTEAGRIVSAAAERNLPFDQAALEYGKVDPAALCTFLAQYKQVERISLELTRTREEFIDSLGERRAYTRWNEPLDADSARLLDAPTARRLCAIPVSQDETGVRVAFADPFFEDALAEIAYLTNRKIMPCLAARGEIEAAIQRVLGQMNLGSALLMAGRITLSQLNDALALAHNSNIRLGRALVHRGYIRESELYHFLARQAGLPLFDLSEVELSPQAARLLDAESERREGFLPLAADDETIYLAMVDPLNENAIRMAAERTARQVHPILVTENDFDLAMEKLYSAEYLDISTSQLLKRSPQDSAFQVFSRGQVIAFILFALLSAAWLVWDYLSYLIVINSIVSIFYLFFSVYKAALISKALSSDLEVEVSDDEIAALKDRDLPIYTILVPVYREAAVLAKILKRLGELDYPATKLDIKILMEANDRETIDAFFLAEPPDFIHAVIVPDAQPKTKPKACNYGLIHARGEYLVIYDAEDLPDPDQLKRVITAFQKTPADVVCIQAKLNYYNRKQNLLTQWFTSEYSMWFDLLLPGLDNARAPIPLGGTSNHFKTFSLIEVGAWDPYNVTEDADLGIRLFKRGYRTRIVDSTTYEEANSQVGNWIRQRSRWIKGYIQTWLVHMRHPLKLLREIGPSAFFSFQLLIGGTFFSLLVNPIYWLMTSAWFFFRWDLIQALFPGSIFYIGALCLYVGNFVFTYVNIAGAMRRKYYDMVRVTLFSPAYWGLMSLGAWKGFLQLLTKPHFWEKTIHGLNVEKEGEQNA